MQTPAEVVPANVRMRRLASRQEWILALVILALGLGLALRSPAFFDPASLRGMAVDALPVLVLAGGMTLVILAGQIDVSIGAQFALCGVVLGLSARSGLGMPLAVGLTLLAGALLGAINAWLVAYARLPAILATLASLAVMRGSLRWASGGEWIAKLPQSFQWYGLGQERGQLAFLLLGLALFLGLAAFLNFTRPGSCLPAVGCDAWAVRSAGVVPERVTAGAFLLMGITCASAACLSFPRYPTVEIEAGLGLELEVIACVVLGGTSIQGGRGGFLGTLLGVVLLSMLASALVFLRVEAAWGRAFQGLVLLLAVVLDALRMRRLD